MSKRFIVIVSSILLFVSFFEIIISDRSISFNRKFNNLEDVFIKYNNEIIQC